MMMITAISVYTFFVLYPWLIYPFILRLAPYDSECEPVELRGAYSTGNGWTVISAGRNCNDRLEDHLRYLDALAEQHGNCQVIYVDDGSTEDNEEFMLDICDRLLYGNVMTLHTGTHVGKELALECAIHCARDMQIMGDSVLFIDVGVKLESFHFPSSASNKLSILRRLDNLKRYQRYDVAGMAFDDDTENESRYIDFEMGLRALEGATGGLIGAGGMAMAMKSAFVPTHLSAPCDLTLVRIAKGMGQRFIPGGPDFVAQYKATAEGSFRRRVRTTMRGMTGFQLAPGETWWNFKLVSHKAMRWFSSMLIALNPLAWLFWPAIKPHAAVLVAAINHARGQRITKWEATKR